jgi:hypothetical protein
VGAEFWQIDWRNRVALINQNCLDSFSTFDGYYTGVFMGFFFKADREKSLYKHAARTGKTLIIVSDIYDETKNFICEVANYQMMSDDHSFVKLTYECRIKFKIKANSRKGKNSFDFIYDIQPINTIDLNSDIKIMFAEEEMEKIKKIAQRLDKSIKDGTYMLDDVITLTRLVLKEDGDHSDKQA